MKLIMCLLLIPFFSHSNSKAIGFILGSPTAIVGQLQSNDKNSYQLGLAFSVDDAFLLYGDYLFHYPGAIKTTEPFVNSLVPYFGLGGVIAITTDDRRNDDGYFGKDDGSFGMGVRVPFGIEWKGKNPPLRVFFEIAPGISIFPETEADFMGGLGLKYSFN
jgi:hypothetical protein